VATKQAIIELNGQRFNALTGTALDPFIPQLQRNVDGILPADEARQYLDEAAKLAPVRQPLTKVVSSPTMSDIVRPEANHLQAKTPQASSTLMRTAVAKPGKSFKRHTTVQVANSGKVTAAPVYAIEIKAAVHAVNPVREQRAKHVAKSQAVRRFTPVKPSHHIAVATVSALPQAPVHHDATPTVSEVPATTTDIFAKALQNATSHKQTKHAKKRHISGRGAVIAASFAAVVVMTGLVATNDATNVKMYLASSKAGFSAALPSYHPAGYRVGNISYNSGVVAVDYMSNSDQRAYTLVQKASNWDSETLRELFVSQQARNYQTVESAGRTIYIFGNRQATWVSGGVWYLLNSNGSLSERQLVDLASSL
jgi:hypothetical protein